MGLSSNTEGYEVGKDWASKTFICTIKENDSQQLLKFTQVVFAVVDFHQAFCWIISTVMEIAFHVENIPIEIEMTEMFRAKV